MRRGAVVCFSTKNLRDGLRKRKPQVEVEPAPAADPKESADAKRDSSDPKAD